MMTNNILICSAFLAIWVITVAAVPTRLEQCNEQRNVKLLGLKWKTWQPFYDEATPCKLLCKVTSINHYKAYGNVEDGTRCIPGGEDFCQDGQCKRAVCDPQDYDKVADKCGICGGKNLFCKQVYMHFDKEASKDVLYNYNYLTTIPSGAKNIRITDKSSINYIALRSGKKSEHLNKGWRLDSPGIYAIAESTALYQRRYGLKRDEESVFILGPISSSINVSVIQQELTTDTSVEYWLETFPADDNRVYAEANQKSEEARELLSKIEIVVNPDKDIAAANKADEERRKLIEVYDIKVNGDNIVVERENSDKPLAGNLAEAKQTEESNAKLLNTFVVNVNKKNNDTVEVKEQVDGRDELVHTYYINVGKEQTAEAKGQQEERAELLREFNIVIQNKTSPPAVVEAASIPELREFLVSGSTKKAVGSTGSDLQLNKKEIMRNYLLNNQVPPVLKNSRISFRIPATTSEDDDEVVSGPVIQSDMECEKNLVKEQNYVKQEPILDIKATVTRHEQVDIQADESAQTTTPRHLFRPIPLQAECDQCTHAKLNRRAYCKTAFVARIRPLSMQVIGDEIRYDSQITFIYRTVSNLNILSREFIYTPVEGDSPACTCPRLGIDREYIVFGNYELDGELLKLFLTKQSIVRTYTLKHMYQLTRLQHRLKC